MTASPGRYLALAWPAADRRAAARADELAARLAREIDGTLLAAFAGLQVWSPADAAPPLRRLPQDAGVVLGELFRAPDAPAGACPWEVPGDAGPVALSARLTRSWWGGYVALLAGGGSGPAVYRDPSGRLGAATWSVDGGVTVVASDLLDAPPWLRPRRLALDWDAVAAVLAAPGAAPGSLFDGVTTVVPGDLQPLADAGRPAVPIWRPGGFAAVASGDVVEQRREMVRRVDLCTAALAGVHGRLLMELSGGLDSAIVAGALAEGGLSGRVAVWLNYAGDRPEGDEREYARSVTDRLGVGLTVACKPDRPLEARDLAELATGSRPALNAADVARDRDTADRVRAAGAGGILSGQGGDAVFFQMPTALVIADALARGGPAVLGAPLLADVARRTRTSVWDVLAQAWRAGRREPAPTVVSPLVAGELGAWAAGLRHPWLAGAAGVSPAKQLQIRALASAQLFRGDCRRGRAAQLLFPLLAQPVVEHALQVAAPDLAGGRHDRPFARDAFAARLPSAVLKRRAKGSLTSYYARMVAGSLDTLRPWLLDGALCAAGLLDRARLDAALDPQQLIQAPESAAILNAAAVEGWVRHWQGRVPDSAAAPRRRG